MSKRRVAGAGGVLVAGVLLALLRWLAPHGGPAPSPARPVETLTAPAVSAPGATLDEAALARLADPALVAQIRRVVDSVDRTGRPPAGVVQGGRRRGARGVFLNAEGRLPRRAPGYYVESDVWPRGADGRGTLRLVFGRDGEVHFTPDHYRSFTRLR